MELLDQVAIVTGGGGSIGQGICTTLADEGAKVVINYLNSLGAAKNLEARIRESGGECHYPFLRYHPIDERRDYGSIDIETLRTFGYLDQ